MKCVFGIVLTLLLAATVVAQSNADALPPGRRRALVIGNDHYPNAPLHNAVNDATAIANQLRTKGFDVTLELDVELVRFTRVIDAFALSVNRGDYVFFYYSGHGYQLENANYITPIDFNATNEDEAKYAGYPMSRVLERIENRGTRLNVMVLDSCRVNPFTSSRGTPGGWAAMNTSTGTLIAFATSPGSTASDNPTEANGLFTKYLLSEMKTPGLNLQQVFERVRSEVYAESNRRQLPWTSSSLIEDFKFEPVGQPGQLTTVFPPPQTAGMTSVRPFAVTPQPPAGAENQRASAVVAGISDTQLSSQPVDAEALFLKGTAEIRLSELNGALNDLNKAIMAQRDYADAYRARGRVQLLLQKWKEALSDFSYCISLNPQDLLALYYRSVADTGAGDFNSAITDATYVIRQAPKIAEAYVSRASAYLAVGRLEDAVQDCSRAIQMNSGIGIAYIVRGKAFQALGISDSARSDYSKASLIQRKTAAKLDAKLNVHGRQP